MKHALIFVLLISFLLGACVSVTPTATPQPTVVASAPTLLSTATTVPTAPRLSITVPPSTPVVRPTATPTMPISFRPLSEDSIIMLIGDLRDEGPPTPWLPILMRRIALASESGVDTVMIVFRTSGVEQSFEELDLLIEEARSKGIGVIPRIVVDSGGFEEMIRTSDDLLPDYTNPEQLQYAVDLLEEVIHHLERFPNVVAYQIEWGHYGESWVNAPFWDSPSARRTFLDFLHQLSPQFDSLGEADLTNWRIGDVMYYCPSLGTADPRSNQRYVAEFFWYQHWRNDRTREITWKFRATARELTQKPIIGFSYVVAGPGGAIGYTYTAQEYLDASFSDWVPYPLSAHKHFIRDAYFSGLHLGELDFDTPYFALREAEQDIANMYARGIVPVIFYPHWSRALSDSDIPQLVNYMNRYKSLMTHVERAPILIVFGRTDVGLVGLDEVGVVVESGLPLWADRPFGGPPGLLPALLSSGLMVDVVSPEVYTPELGALYPAVIVVVPRDGLDHEFQERLVQTDTSIIIVYPSFIISTPTPDLPTNVESAYCGYWNHIRLGAKQVRVQVWGVGPGVPYPSIRFQGMLASLGTLEDYTPNHVFSYYQGSFDEIYAVADFPSASFPTIARVGNIWLFGLDTHLSDDQQREVAQRAFLSILRQIGVDSKLEFRQTPSP